MKNIPKKPLLSLLKELDSNLFKKISVFAVGGTGMTLLNLKASTKDIDFNLDSADLEYFKEALSKIEHGFDIDIFVNGCIFSQQLPEDYKQKSIIIEEKFKNIDLYSIHPLDIVVTKIGRFNDRDEEDIIDCIKKYDLKKEEIRKRAEQVIYVGKEENYLYNLSFILKNFF
jgi:hypothetical protein